MSLIFGSRALLSVAEWRIVEFFPFFFLFLYFLRTTCVGRSEVFRQDLRPPLDFVSSLDFCRLERVYPAGLSSATRLFSLWSTFCRLGRVFYSSFSLLLDFLSAGASFSGWTFVRHSSFFPFSRLFVGRIEVYSVSFRVLVLTGVAAYYARQPISFKSRRFRERLQRP